MKDVEFDFFLLNDQAHISACVGGIEEFESFNIPRGMSVEGYATSIEYLDARGEVLSKLCDVIDAIKRAKKELRIERARREYGLRLSASGLIPSALLARSRLS